ncbi:MAG: NAD-dependent epimerase/dehydratase family protein [Chloroflexi bacterium]|nr:NAD-dependent epimerase/dehydratase family protein [Chloroflexota bacterium]
MSNPLAQDLDHVLTHTEGLWDGLRGQRVFITGGTGFFGCWLLETFAWANDRLNLAARVVTLTRSPVKFRAKAPRLAAHPAIELWPGDILSCDFPAGAFAYVIHAAGDASPTLTTAGPLAVWDTLVAGTRRVLGFAHLCTAKSFLLTSSGAVYGRQPAEVSHLSEEYQGAPNPLDPRAAYGEGKRAAELLCALYARRHGVPAKIARGFAFIGPYLPLDAQYAAGNFIRDALAGGPIRVTGDGAAYRSYLYAADLAAWLWTILLRGEPCRPYNVGSEQAITIGDLARAVADCFPATAGRSAGSLRPEVQIAQAATPGRPAERYVPSVARARHELGLQQTVSLPEAIRRTIAWHTP